MSCTKTKYSSEAFAMQELERLQKTSSRIKKPIACYLCAKCNSWHLTSKPNYVDVIKGLELENKELKRKLQILTDNIKNLYNKTIKTK